LFLALTNTKSEVNVSSLLSWKLAPDLMAPYKNFGLLPSLFETLEEDKFIPPWALLPDKASVFSKIVPKSGKNNP
jgi:hypothetical protein